MSSVVVDASVAVKWYLSEPYSEPARIILRRPGIKLVPDLIFPEVGNILWKRVTRGEMSRDDASSVISSFCSMPLRVFRGEDLTLIALEIACQTGRSVYDSLYVALAVRENTYMVTADERLYNALKNTPLASRVQWIGAL